MEHKQAVGILISMLDKRELSAGEKEALMTAVGVLAWTKLSKSKVEAIKAKRNREEGGETKDNIYR